MIVIKATDSGEAKGVVSQESKDSFLTGEVVLGYGKITVGTATSGNFIGLCFEEGEEENPIGAKRGRKKGELLKTHGSVLVWIDSLESAEVVQGALNNLVTKLKRRRNDNS